MKKFREITDQQIINRLKKHYETKLLDDGYIIEEFRVVNVKEGHKRTIVIGDARMWVAGFGIDIGKIWAYDSFEIENQ